MLYRIHHPRKSNGRPGPIIGYMHLCDHLFFNQGNSCKDALFAKLEEAKIIPKNWYDRTKLAIRCCAGLLYGAPAYDVLYDARLLKRVLYIHQVPKPQVAQPSSPWGHGSMMKFTTGNTYGIPTTTAVTVGGQSIYGDAAGQVIMWDGQNLRWGNR
jgi:hypothetical protein